MEATSAGRVSNLHNHPNVLTQSSIPCSLPASELGEKVAKAQTEQAPDRPGLAAWLKAVLLGHVETLQEQIGELLLTER